MALTLATIERARVAIGPHVLRTPLLSSRTLGERSGGSAVHLKAENLQRAGSFKARGAVNALLALSPAARACGVVTMSAGNAAQAVAWAGQRLGAPVTVVMPDTAPTVSIEATRAYGGLIRFARDITQLMPIVRELVALGLHFIHPFDDDTFNAGSGTLALEVLEDLPTTDVIVVGIGGGGLVSGIATAARALRPGIRIIGVEPEGAAGMTLALAAGHPVPLTAVRTIASGLGAPYAGERTLPVVRALVEEVIVLGDHEIAAGTRFLAERARLVVEPAGAAAVGALLAGRVNVRPGENVVAVLSGGNLDLARLAEIFAL
ncbi:MAG: threonine/serine dehydratase [Chloroflexi bacterium]|nr:threonine/serine dehydratase [Chloroflexota bacterium]